VKPNSCWTRVYVLLACIVVSVLVLTGCASPAVKQPATVGAKYGGTLHLAYVQDITFLDPAKSSTIADRAIPYLYANTLIKWVGKNDENPQVGPCLATSWDAAPDGLSYTFHLRQGVKWQNLPPVNGREFVAADVKWSFERVLDPKLNAPLAAYYNAIDHVDTPDKYTVKVVMRTPDPYFLYAVCGGHIGAHEVADQEGDLNKTVIGTGPFMIDKYTPGVGITFKRNPDYWDTGKPYLDRVECTSIVDPAARLAAFRSGQLDRVAEGKTNADLIKSSVAGAQIVPGINILGSCLVFSLDHKDQPWADVRVRKALQYAIDYDGLIQAVLNGSGSRTDYLAPSFKDWGARQIADLPQYDPAKAKSMLAEAGYPDGFKTTLLQHTNRLDAWGGAVEPLAAMLKKVGIDATIVPAAQADYVAKMREEKFDLATGVMICAAPDPDGSIVYMYVTKQGYNRSGYNNAKLNALVVDERKAAGNLSQRQQDFKQMLQMLADDVPVIPLYYQYDFSITQPWVKGWDNAADPATATAWYEVANVWLEKK
jgi:peptide/nickel transport system substrate-binding protein